MKISLDFNNQTKSPVRKSFFISVAKKTIQKNGYDFLEKKNLSLSIALISPQEIRKINKIYRNKDYVTDILSFASYKSVKEIKKSKEKAVFLGELILCYDDIKDYAKKNGLNFKEELARTVSHGILHLLDFHHGKIMFSLQDKIANKFS